jgi:hypothetical protein
MRDILCIPAEIPGIVVNQGDSNMEVCFCTRGYPCGDTGM